jgi:hypothetical protein
MKTRSAVALLGLAFAGCASMRLAEARDAYLQAELGAWVYRQDCKVLWPDVLRQIASQGYSLVGADRNVAGEPPQSGAANFFSEGFETRETYDGGLVVASDWNKSWVRVRASGAVVGSSCKVGFTRVEQPDTDDPGKTRSGTDWDMALGLLRRVDPAAAARVEAGVPRAAP